MKAMQYVTAASSPFVSALQSAVARFLRAKRLAANAARRNARAEWRERDDANRIGIRGQILLSDLLRVPAGRRRRVAHEAVARDARLCAHLANQPECPPYVRGPLISALIAANEPIAPADAVSPRSAAFGTARYRACGTGRERAAKRARIEISRPEGDA